MEQPLIILFHIYTKLEIRPELLKHHFDKPELNPKVDSEKLDTALIYDCFPEPDRAIVATALIHQKINLEIVLLV